tara:strand:+ start:4633 stop:4869 length:237 start_codon:yes stop_codon:yes gene_type:complete
MTRRGKPEVALSYSLLRGTGDTFSDNICACDKTTWAFDICSKKCSPFLRYFIYIQRFPCFVATRQGVQDLLKVDLLLF